MEGARVTGETPGYDTDFVDVTRLPLDQLLALGNATRGDSALDHSLRRLAYEIAHPQEAVAGHNSAITYG
jgi:FXSXX-COOH protein